MINNNVGGNVGVTLQNSTLHACPSHEHGKTTARLVRRVDEAWQRLLCLLHPPLHHAHRPSFSSSSLKAQKHGPPDVIVPNDSERSADNTLASPRTPSSSRAPAPSTPTHQSSSAARAGKRRDLGEADVQEAIVVEKETKTVDQRSSPTYKLILIQEPTTGSAFEDNLLGRIGLAPPLILELEVTRDGKVQDASEELPFLICQCSLLKEDGSIADMVDQSATASTSSSSTLLPPTPKRSRRGRRSSSGRRGSTRSTESSDTHTPASAAASSSATPASSGEASPSLARMLYGTIVAGPQQFPPPEGDQEKPYFFFPEISIRTTGKFKIQCRLMRLALPGISPSQTGVLASVETQPFEVVKREDYIAPYITDVSRHFARLGVPLLLPPGVSAD